MHISNMQISHFTELISWKDRHHRMLQFKPLLDLIHQIIEYYGQETVREFENTGAGGMGGSVEKGC